MVNEIEALTDAGKRLAAYQRYLEATPHHAPAWSNLAVEELDRGDRVAARRALLHALAIDAGLPMPPRLAQLVEVEGHRIESEIHSGPMQLLYAARSPVGARVLLRRILGRAQVDVRAAYEAQQRLGETYTQVARALGTVTDAAGELFQVLEHEAGHVLGQLLCGDGPQRGFGIAQVPRIGDDMAGTLAAETLELTTRLPELALDLDPDLYLRTRRGIVALGPPGLAPTPEWIAPEERHRPSGPNAATYRADAVDPAAVTAYRAGLFVWTAIVGRRPPTLDVAGRRELDLEQLPAHARMLAPTLAKACSPIPSDRPAPPVLLERLRAAVSTTSIDRRLGFPTLPDYKIVKRLGEGGFGVVYEALRIKDGAQAAIKVLHPHLSANGEARMRFFNEASVAAGINHRGVVKIYGSGTHEGTHFLAMELIHGESLQSRLLREHELRPDDVIRIGCETANAVGAVHTSAGGVVHRDLKPGNILLENVGPGAAPRVKVVDFGIAKLLGDPTTDGLPFTRTGHWNGTPPYMAPEQWRQTDVDARTDVYALGCMLYECLAGRPPFVESKPYDLLKAHLEHEPPPLPDEIPEALRRVVMRMLSKDPADRYPDMAAVEAALRKAGTVTAEVPTVKEPEKVPEPPPPPPPPSAEAKRKVPAIAWVAAGGLVVGIVAYALWPKSPKDDTHDELVREAEARATEMCNCKSRCDGVAFPAEATGLNADESTRWRAARALFEKCRAMHGSDVVPPAQTSCSLDKIQGWMRQLEVLVGRASCGPVRDEHLIALGYRMFTLNRDPSPEGTAWVEPTPQALATRGSHHHAQILFELGIHALRCAEANELTRSVSTSMFDAAARYWRRCPNAVAAFTNVCMSTVAKHTASLDPVQHVKACEALAESKAVTTKDDGTLALPSCVGARGRLRGLFNCAMTPDLAIYLPARVRCMNDKVELDRCPSACSPQPTGTDDVCR